MHELAILLVDNEPQSRLRSQEILRERAVQITLATSGREALTLVTERAFHVLFVELELPDRNGLGLIWEARRLRPELRSVVLTGRATVETSIEALRFGVCDLVQKPVCRSALLAALDRALAGGAAMVGPAIVAEQPIAAADMISVPLEGSLKQIERRLVEEVIHRHDGNKTAAARSLGMHRKALYRLINSAPPEAQAKRSAITRAGSTPVSF